LIKQLIDDKDLSELLTKKFLSSATIHDSLVQASTHAGRLTKDKKCLNLMLVEDDLDRASLVMFLNLQVS